MTTALKNRMSKSRKPGNAYITTRNPVNDWEYEILKSYQGDNTKPFARVFCNVHGFETEMGDVYVSEIGTQLVTFDREVFTDAADALGALFGGGQP